MAWESNYIRIKQCNDIMTLWMKLSFYTLQWHHNGHNGVSNHQPHDCLLNRLFRSRWKKTSQFCVAGLCAENSTVNDEFPAQMASYAIELPESKRPSAGWAPLYYYKLSFILHWISNYIHYEMCHEFTHPFSNRCAVENGEWRRNLIPHFTEHVITYPCRDLR